MNLEELFMTMSVMADTTRTKSRAFQRHSGPMKNRSRCPSNRTKSSSVNHTQNTISRWCHHSSSLVLLTFVFNSALQSAPMKMAFIKMTADVMNVNTELCTKTQRGLASDVLAAIFASVSYTHMLSMWRDAL